MSLHIGIDLGGINIAAGIVDTDGKLVYSTSIPTRKERNSGEIIKDIENLIFSLMDSDIIKKDSVESIGVGIPGIVDYDTGNVIECVNLNWHEIPLRKQLEKVFKLPVSIENDATLAGLAEFKAGSMQKVKNGVFITLGTGVGSGIIIDGKIHQGSNGIGSEVGHMIVGSNFYDCSCGRNGCLETFSSATALINYTKKLLEEESSTIINEKINGDMNSLSGQIIFEAARKGDNVANMAVDRLVKYLSIGIINVTSIIDPEVFVLGGGISKAGNFLLDKLKESLNKNKYFNTLPVGDIRLAELGNEAGVIGAAMLGKQYKDN